jgi:hypothetical protein
MLANGDKISSATDMHPILVALSRAISQLLHQDWVLCFEGFICAVPESRLGIQFSMARP